MCKEHFDRRMVQEDVQLNSMIQLFKRILPKFDFGECEASPLFATFARTLSELMMNVPCPLCIQRSERMTADAYLIYVTQLQ